MIRLMPIFGTRPEAIKLAPVILAAQRQKDLFEVHVCVTGQHRDMLDQMLAVFGITPDTDLALMRPNQTLADISARTIQAVTPVLQRERPDWVLVQGDTTTVWAAAMAAFFQQIPVAHVEAGLRTNDKRQPFPEEINRRITTQIADLHFAPTESARDSLLKEGVPPALIHVTGNTVIDALQWILARLDHDPSPDVAEISNWAESTLGDRQMVLITGHRRESFGGGFESICMAIGELARRFPQVSWVYPVHLNPRVQEPVYRILGNSRNVHLIAPQPYAAFAWLMRRCRLILTDSGGVQEEAPSLGKPVLVMRETTERPEGVQVGTSILVGTCQRRIVETAESFLCDDVRCEQVRLLQNPYGDGQSSVRILQHLHDVRKG